MPGSLLTIILTCIEYDPFSFVFGFAMNPQPKSPHACPPAENTAERPRVDSEQLFRGAPAVEIEHAGQRYLLRVTRENKLILTK